MQLACNLVDGWRFCDGGGRISDTRTINNYCKICTCRNEQGKWSTHFSSSSSRKIIQLHMTCTWMIQLFAQDLLFLGGGRKSITRHSSKSQGFLGDIESKVAKIKLIKKWFILIFLTEQIMVVIMINVWIRSGEDCWAMEIWGHASVMRWRCESVHLECIHQQYWLIRDFLIGICGDEESEKSDRVTFPVRKPIDIFVPLWRQRWERSQGATSCVDDRVQVTTDESTLPWFENWYIMGHHYHPHSPIKRPSTWEIKKKSELGEHKGLKERKTKKWRVNDEMPKPTLWWEYKTQAIRWSPSHFTLTTPRAKVHRISLQLLGTR